MDKCQKCGKVLSASRDSATLCADCIALQNGDEPAFPTCNRYGLTKREWFAGMALQGLCVGYFDNVANIKVIASVSFDFADAMIKKGQE